MLYQRRKFDVRCFLLIASINGHLRAYWYPEGYLRTSSKLFDLHNTDDLFAHLTNDCLQKKCEDYGSFEEANKLTFKQMEAYLNAADPSNSSGQWSREIVPHMIKISRHLVRSVANKLNPKSRSWCFELVGLDFMVDSTGQVYLLEANNNPSLVHSKNESINTLLQSVIEQTIQLTVDVVFGIPDSHQPMMPANTFKLIYDQQTDRYSRTCVSIKPIVKLSCNRVQEKEQ